MHNPLRSEAEMFRVVVIVGIALAPVIAVGLIAGPGWGAGLLLAEIAVGAWASGAAPAARSRTRPSSPPTTTASYRLLVVANQTVAGQALLSEIERRCAAHERSEILVVVPALTSSRLEHLAHDVDGAIAEARQRLDGSLATMRGAGLSARGQVGDHHDPNVAIEDALRDLRRRRADRLHPPARALEVARARCGRAGARRDPAAGHPRGRRPGGRGRAAAR